MERVEACGALRREQTYESLSLWAKKQLSYWTIAHPWECHILYPYGHDVLIFRSFLAKDCLAFQIVEGQLSE